MRLQDIVYMLRGNLMFATSITIVVGIVIYVGYRKLLGGKKQWTAKQVLVIALFSVYMMTVFALTFLSRGANFNGSTNLSLFSSYREAWYNFSVTDWQYIYFNMLMFVPFGFFLPLLHKRFSRIGWMLACALLFTGLIETIQFITGHGIFELDDIFNNVLGAVIGFGVVQAFLPQKNNWMRVTYLSPLLVVIILSGGMFAYYEAKDYGNLSIVPATNVKMKEVVVSSNIPLDDEKQMATVYKAPSLSKQEAQQYAYGVFEKLGLDTTNIEIIDYQNEANYRYQGNPAYFIWLHYLDRTYSYIDFSYSDEGVALVDTDEATLKAEFERFGITIPEQARFEQIEVGRYKWQVDQVQIGDQLIDGTLTTDYYNDGTVKNFNQQIVTYEKVQDVELKSVQAAYDELLEGRFIAYKEHIQQIEIDQVEMGYALDSKGFYQPIYEFSGLVDGERMTMLIPGIE